MSEQVTELQNELTEETVRRLIKEVRDPNTRNTSIVFRLRDATERLRGLLREAKHDGVVAMDDLGRLLRDADALLVTMDRRMLNANKTSDGAIVAV